MINDILIIEDAVPQAYANKIEELMLIRDFSWFFRGDITYPDHALEKTGQLNEKRPGFGNLIYDINLGAGNLFNFIAPIVLTTVEKYNIPFNQILQMRGFLSLPLLSTSLSRIDKPHIDNPLPHIVALYYVNDSDGDTIIFDKKYQYGIQNFYDLEAIDPENIPILEKISPKKGKLVFFNGAHYHASSQPTAGPRCVINFNLN